jgi:hypothetical protein
MNLVNGIRTTRAAPYIKFRAPVPDKLPPGQNIFFQSIDNHLSDPRPQPHPLSRLTNV